MMQLNRFNLKIIQKQIQSKNYSFDLKGKVIYIGLAHHGKDVKMKWVER